MTSTQTFDQRNTEKIIIDKKEKTARAKPMEIWWMKLWKNIGFEQDWKQDFLRPILVIRIIWNMIFAIPMTTKQKSNKFYYKLKSTNQKKDSLLILSQWRTIDTKRLIKKIWKIKKEEFNTIKKLLQQLYIGEVF